MDRGRAPKGIGHLMILQMLIIFNNNIHFMHFDHWKDLLWAQGMNNFVHPEDIILRYFRVISRLGEIAEIIVFRYSPLLKSWLVISTWATHTGYANCTFHQGCVSV